MSCRLHERIFYGHGRGNYRGTPRQHPAGSVIALYPPPPAPQPRPFIATTATPGAAVTAEPGAPATQVGAGLSRGSPLGRGAAVPGGADPGGPGRNRGAAPLLGGAVRARGPPLAPGDNNRACFSAGFFFPPVCSLRKSSPISREKIRRNPSLSDERTDLLKKTQTHLPRLLFPPLIKHFQDNQYFMMSC